MGPGLVFDNIRIEQLTNTVSDLYHTSPKHPITVDAATATIAAFGSGGDTALASDGYSLASLPQPGVSSSSLTLLAKDFEPCVMQPQNHVNQRHSAAAVGDVSDVDETSFVVEEMSSAGKSASLGSVVASVDTESASNRTVGESGSQLRRVPAPVPVGSTNTEAGVGSLELSRATSSRPVLDAGMLRRRSTSGSQSPLDNDNLLPSASPLGEPQGGTDETRLSESPQHQRRSSASSAFASAFAPPDGAFTVNLAATVSREHIALRARGFGWRLRGAASLAYFVGSDGRIRKGRQGAAPGTDGGSDLLRPAQIYLMHRERERLRWMDAATLSITDDDDAESETDGQDEVDDTSLQPPPPVGEGDSDDDETTDDGPSTDDADTHSDSDPDDPAGLASAAARTKRNATARIIDSDPSKAQAILRTQEKARIKKERKALAQAKADAEAKAAARAAKAEARELARAQKRERDEARAARKVIRAARAAARASWAARAGARAARGTARNAAAAAAAARVRHRNAAVQARASTMCDDPNVVYNVPCPRYAGGSFSGGGHLVIFNARLDARAHLSMAATAAATAAGAASMAAAAATVAAASADSAHHEAIATWLCSVGGHKRGHTRGFGGAKGVVTITTAMEAHGGGVYEGRSVQ